MSAYWICAYKTVHDTDKVAAYAELAGPAIREAGGRFLVRGTPEATYELGEATRTVVIEFESVQAAVAAHESAGYQEALRALGDGADRDLRVVPGSGRTEIRIVPASVIEVHVMDKPSRVPLIGHGFDFGKS